MRSKLLGLLGVVGLLFGLVMVAGPSQASDHLDAPLVQADGRTDINDLYAFQSPDNPENVVLIMTVNPVAGVLSPTTFDPKAAYRFLIDTDGDARADVKISVKFGKVMEDGTQKVKINGAAGEGKGRTGNEIALDNGGRAMIGTFDDPFFFDFQAFLDQVKGSGGTRTFDDGNEVDFFAGLNVSAIVLEIPADSLLDNDEDGECGEDEDDDGDGDGAAEDSVIGVWAETKHKGDRIDRVGRPAIATVLIDNASKDAFNRGRPRNDRRDFGRQLRDNLLFLSGLDGTPYSVTEVEAITNVLLPDILTIDVSDPAGFLNGRGLADDVIDAELSLVTGGFFGGTPVLTTDAIDANDVPFPGTFPYLAPAH